MNDRVTDAAVVVGVLAIMLGAGGWAPVPVKSSPEASDSLKHLLPAAYAGSGFTYPLRAVINDSARFRR